MVNFENVNAHWGVHSKYGKIIFFWDMAKLHEKNLDTAFIPLYQSLEILTLREKCPNTKLFLVRIKSPYSLRIQENTDQK